MNQERTQVELLEELVREYGRDAGSDANAYEWGSRSNLAETSFANLMRAIKHFCGDKLVPSDFVEFPE